MRPEVQPWLRRGARFILNVFTNTPTDESLALLATTELTTSRDDVGEKYGLALLQFFLNHRRFPRSERPERVGKSPAELLDGSPHPHWLEMLGYVRFSRN